MRALKNLLLAALCLAMAGAAAHAENELISIQAPEDFVMYRYHVTEEGEILVGGGFGTRSDLRGGMLRIGLDGSCTDITPPEDRAEGVYADIIQLNADTFIVDRSVPGDIALSRVGCMKNGEAAWRTEKIEDVMSLDRVGDGFLLNCKPAPVTLEIRKMDFDGNEEWTLRLKERIVLRDILVGEDVSIAQGIKYEEPHEDGTQSFALIVFAFDNSGNILWRYDAPEYDNPTILDSARTEDGCILLLDDSGIAKYGPEGEIWRRELTASHPEHMAAVDGGYLVTFSPLSALGMRFLMLDARGAVLSDYYSQDRIAFSRGYPFEYGGDVYMLLEGVYPYTGEIGRPTREGWNSLSLLKLDMDLIAGKATR